MTLTELAVGYRDTARKITERIHELERQKDEAEDPVKRGQLENRIKILYTMRREASEIAVLCERYYDRGYRRNGKYTI